MNTISLASLQEQVRARKAALGIDDTPAQTEALRNSGAGRTSAKRELLRRTEERARTAGLQPVASHY